MPLLQTLKNKLAKNPRGWYPALVYKPGSCGGFRKIPVIVKMEILEKNDPSNQIKKAKIMKIVDLVGNKYTRAHPIDDLKYTYTVGDIYYDGFLYSSKEAAFSQHQLSEQTLRRANYSGIMMQTHVLPNGRKRVIKRHYHNGRRV